MTFGTFYSLSVSSSQLPSKEEANATSRWQSSGMQVYRIPPLRRNAFAASNVSSEIENLLAVVNYDSENAPSTKVEGPPDNEFEERLRPDVITANEIGVTFDDIGGLEDIKKLLHMYVIYPLKRPELFNDGILEPCRGVLLFGPPGTGKTMLAKAIAKEARASFINVSMSTITSKWFGEDEKNVRALFTLAAKISPTIIFMDEVDSMLGQRTGVGEHEASRKVKNEFMTQWDGLLTKADDRILVLAATNRPFDLDEAIIRRFEHRIMVGLPTVVNREMILKNILSKGKGIAEDIDYKELAVKTKGYTGSDLRILCKEAARRRVVEIIEKEMMKDMEKKKREAAGKSSEDASDSKDEGKEDSKEEPVTIRPLVMEDLRQALNEVPASVSSDSALVSELERWNDIYGKGGSRMNQQLSYFT